MSDGPTNAEKIRSLPFVMAFDAFNAGFCALAVLGSVFTLFLGELGMPKSQIGSIMSLVPLASMGAILLAPLSARIGIKKVFVAFWGTRNVFSALTLLTPAVAARHGLVAAGWYVGGCMACFSLCRAFGEAANTQWRHEIIPPAIRGRFAAIDNIISTLTAAAALLAAGWVLRSSGSIWRYAWVMGIGTAIGFASVIWASQMPGGGEVIKKPRGFGFHLRRFRKVLGDRNFILYMAAMSLVGFGSAPLAVFVPLFLREQAGLKPESIVVLQNAALAGTLISSYLWGWAADRFGSKPVIITGLCLLLGPPLGWLLLPPHSTWTAPLTAGVFLLGGVASVGYSLGTWRQLYVNIVPTRRKTHYMSIFCAWMGASNGLGNLLAGQSMDLAKGLSGSVGGLSLSPFSFLFLFSIVMLLLGLLIQRRVRCDGAIPASRFVGMLLQGNPLLAVESLFRYSRAGSDAQRVQLLRRLGRSRSPLSEDELEEALADPSFNVRYEAVVAIARSRPSPRLTAELIDLLVGGPPDLAIEAAWALGRIGDPAAIAPLRWVLAAGQPPLLQLRAARALSALGDAELPAELARRLAEGEPSLRRAYAALAAPPPRAQREHRLRELRRRWGGKALLAGLADPDFEVRLEAMLLARRHCHDTTLAYALVRLLEAGEPDESIEAATALGRMQAAQAAEPLLRAMEDPRPLLRARAARALAALGEARAEGELRRRLAGDEDIGIRIAYASALGELGVRSAAGDIIRLIEQVPQPGWARELNLALARLVDESGYVRLWRRMRHEPGTAAARCLHGPWRRAQQSDRQALASALGECVRRMGDDDVPAGAARLADALQALPPGDGDRCLLAVTAYCARALRRPGPAQAESLPLAVTCLQAAMRKWR